MDYGDIIYDKPHNKSFKNKIENVQYKVFIVINGAIQETWREHLYHELGLKSLGDREWFCKLTFFIKLWMELLQSILLIIWILMITEFRKQEWT